MTYHKQRPWFVTLLAVLALTALAGCGGAGTPDTATRESQVIEIAENYTRDGDMATATARLADLRLPNERQFLALLTERYINEQPDAAVTGDLVRLSRDLGMVTALIAAYDTGEAASGAGAVAPTGAPPVAPTAAQVAMADTATARPTDVAVSEPTPAPTDAPTATVATAPTETPTPVPPAAMPTSTLPRVRADRNVNVRAGPGTGYPVISALQTNEEMPVTGRTADGSWWQVCCVGQQSGWVSASVVVGLGDVQSVAVAVDIPTPAPTVPPPPTATNAPPPAVQPTATLQTVPIQAPPPTQPPAAPGGIDFRIIEQRMLSNVENGGSFDGDSLHCGLGHTIYVRVVDAGGNPLDGVIVRGIYYGDLPITGTKGPGTTSEDLFSGGGDELIVDRDASGRTYSSEKTRGLVNRTRDIPISDYIAGGYCRDEADCQNKINNNQMCEGHYSYSVVFQRTW